MAYKRSIFLINRKFQLRFSFYVCSWLFVLSLVYPYAMYGQLEQFLRYVSLDPMGPALSQLQTIRDEMVGMIVLLQVVFMVTTFLVSIFISHRIAGPLYKLNQFFIRAKNGDFHHKISFRKPDHFQELASGYNNMMHTLDNQLAQIATAVEGGKKEEALDLIHHLRKHKK